MLLGGTILGSWLSGLVFARAPEAIISDLMEILGSTGSISLDELLLRSSGTSSELISELTRLQRQGSVVIEGPHSHSLEELSEPQIAADSLTRISVSRRALAAWGG